MPTVFVCTGTVVFGFEDSGAGRAERALVAFDLPDPGPDREVEHPQTFQEKGPALVFNEPFFRTKKRQRPTEDPYSQERAMGGGLGVSRLTGGVRIAAPTSRRCADKSAIRRRTGARSHDRSPSAHRTTRQNDLVAGSRGRVTAPRRVLIRTARDGLAFRRSLAVMRCVRC
jgi:hypothetical protein